MSSQKSTKIKRARYSHSDHSNNTHRWQDKRKNYIMKNNNEYVTIIPEYASLWRELSLIPNPWETKNRGNTRQKKNNYTHKIIFMWFGNLPTSTKLQGYHYYQGRIQSTAIGYNIFSLYITRQQHHTKKS